METTSSWRAHERIAAIELAIAGRVKAIRTARGISQEKLGQALGVTFQQVQKYENGSNRISAGKLAVVAATLGVRVADFYEPSERLDDAVAAMRCDAELYAVCRKVPPEARSYALKMLRALRSQEVAA